MGDLLPVGLLYGPLLALGAVQLFGVRRLFGVETLKTLLWGLAFAMVGVPLMSVIGGLDAPATPETFVMAGLRMIRIWLIVWTMAMATRIGWMLFRYAWRRRPRKTA